MNIRATATCLLTGVILSAATLHADRVKLRSGQVITGTFLGGDASTVRMLMDNGRTVRFDLVDVTGVEFTARKTAPPPKAPDPVKAPSTLTLPKDTILNVRLTTTIDVDSSETGQVFKSLLDDPVMVSGTVVVPRGAVVMLQAAHVEQAGTMKGSDKITLKANAMTFGGRQYEIVTTYVETKGQSEGKAATRKIGGGAGLGAAIGGIAGGGKGAAIGALAGAGAGAVMASQGTNHLKLEAESRLQFKLNAAVTIQP